MWLWGLVFFREDNFFIIFVGVYENFVFILDDDKEVRFIVVVNRMIVKEEICNFFKICIEWYFNWIRLVCSIVILRYVLFMKDFCEYLIRWWYYCL